MQSSSRLLYFIISLLYFQLAVLAKVRGIPGVDYPNYSSIPKTSFKCPDFTPGFYADLETRCQVFHYCYEHRKESFLCPEGTTFNEAIKSCDYWYSSECDSTQTSYEGIERKLKQSPYNDVPLVPVNAETNNIFDKMAALYEPKIHTENFIHKEQEEAGSNYFEDLRDNGNENYEPDSTYPLPAQEILSNEMTENSQMENNVRDFVKYEHESIEGDGVDIRFHDNSVQIFPYNNNEVYIRSIASLSETETSRYLNQDTTTEKKDKYKRYNTEEQNELFTTHYPQPVDNINFSDHESSDSLLIKRLSDNSDAPKKRFRRKPTYVVLQTQESDESTSKSTAYGVEQNQPNKDVYGDKSNAYHHTFLTESPTPGMKETETKLKEDLVQKSDRKFRRNRKILQTFTDQSEKLQNETKFVEEYQPTKDVYIDTATVYQSSYKESTPANFLKAEKKQSEDIKMSVKKPRQNRKKIHMLVDEPDEENDETKEHVKEDETRKNIYYDKENAYHFLQTNTDSFILDKVTDNKPEDFNTSAGKPNLNKTLGMYVDESKKTNADLTESTKLNQEFIMPANIMSPSFETDEEPIILVSNDTIISETDTFITTQPAITQAAVSITPIAPDSITTLQLIENELEDTDNIIKNFSHVEEPHISFHKLKTAETDVMSKEPHIHESNPAGIFEKVTQNNQNFIPLLLNMNSEVEDQTYSEQDMNLDNNKNMHSDVEDNVYPEEINSDTINMRPADEDLVYSEQEISSDNTLYVDTAADTAYSEQETYPHHIVNMDSEFEELEYSGEEMNPGDIATHIINDQSHAISYEILKSDEQADQYHGQNNYGNGDYGFSGAYDMFSQTIKSDSNNYVMISTLSPIAITDESSTANFMNEDNNEHNLVYENSDSFEDEQMHYVNNLKAMYSEHEGLKFVEEEINSDLNAAISDSINEDETKSFSDKTEDFESNVFHEILDNVISTESTSLREDIYSDYVENAELYGLEKSLDLNTKENVPLQEEETEHYKEKEHLFDFELSTTSESIPKIIKEISNQTNSFYNESFESSIVLEDSKFEKEVERGHIAKTPEELFKTSTVVEHLNNIYTDKNSPFSKIPEKSLGSSTFVEGSEDNKTHEYGINAKISEESLENFPIIELKDINIDEKATFAKITDTDAELFHIYPSANHKLPSKSFDELDDTTILTKTRKDTLLETKLQNEAKISNNLSSHPTKNENGAFKELILNPFEINPTNTMKATSGFVEKSQDEEEKPIDSVFHSSSMPLPANIFEQGLYKQNLLQDENYQINRDKIYPATFYKELDELQEKPKNEKSAVVNTSHNKKYRSLNFNFPLGEMNLENVDDLSSKYREPSLLSLFAPSQTVKKLFPIDIFGLKNNGFFSPPVAKISKPIKVKKLVAFGKNLLAFKRAKLNDFKLMFHSFINEI